MKCLHCTSGIYCKKFKKPCLCWTWLWCKIIGGDFLVPADQLDNHNEDGFIEKLLIVIILVCLTGLIVNAWHNGSLPGLKELIGGLLK